MFRQRQERNIGMESAPQSVSAQEDSRLELTSEIVAAYVSNNPLPASDLPGLISSIWRTLSQLSHDSAADRKPKLVPAVPIKKSVTNDYIICLEDGDQFKSLKRPLMARYGMTPEEYRAKWGLPSDYPMTAPSYAEKRSQLAKRMGLGRKPEATKTTKSRRKVG